MPPVEPSRTRQPSAVDDPPSLAAFSCLSAADWVLLALLCSFMVAVTAYRSRTRLLWADELLCYQVFADPSFPHRLQAWSRGADGGGVFYYVLGSLWFRVFSLSELSLRLFSTVATGAALIALWAALRRYASLAVTALSLGVIFFTPPVLLWQTLNGRFYGLLFASAAFTALLTLLVLERVRPSGQLLLFLLLAHCLLIGSHIFGLLFSISFLAGTVLADRLRGLWRPRVYLVPAVSWGIALLSVPATRASASVVGKYFWTRKPAPLDLLLSFAGYGRLTAAVLLSCGAAALLRLVLQRFLPRGSREERAFWAKVPVAPLTVTGSLVLADLLFYAKSQVGPSIFADRYLLPLLIGSAFLLAASLTVLLPRALARPRHLAINASVAVLGLLPCCLFSATRNVNYSLYPGASYARHVEALLRPGVPAVASLPVFPFLHVYDPQQKVLFQTDWDFANDPAHPSDYSGERLMENWKRAGYLSDDILPCTELFARYPQTDLLVSPHDYPWFNDRVLHSPNFRVTAVGIVREWDWVDVYRVDRVRPGPPPC